MADDGWYLGKYLKEGAKATWRGLKTVGGTVAEHPVAGTVGAVGGFMVGGPVGAVGGAVAGAGLSKAIKEADAEDKAKK